MLPILNMRYKKAGGIIRQGHNFNHTMLQQLSFVRRIRRTNTQKMHLFPEGRYVILSD